LAHRDSVAQTAAGTLEQKDGSFAEEEPGYFKSLQKVLQTAPLAKN
jgi:hypothetical protein